MINIPDLKTDAGSVSPVSLTLAQPATGSGFSWGSAWGEVKDLAKFYTAAKLAPGSLTSAPVTPTTPTTPEASKGLADVLSPIASVYAADQANQRLNKNPPWTVYALLGFGLAFTYVVLNRPSGGKGA